MKADPIFVGRAFEGWVICGVSESVNTLVWSVRFAFALFYVAVLHAFDERRGEAALGYSLSRFFPLFFWTLAAGCGADQ